jgi:hypothetical protein
MSAPPQHVANIQPPVIMVMVLGMASANARMQCILCLFDAAFPLGVLSM